MPFDALTVHGVCDELSAVLTGGYVERVVRSGAAEFALQIYARPTTRYLLVSAEAEHERVCLIQRLPPRLDAPDSPFQLLLRKHVRGSVVVGISQPYLERVLRIDLEQRDEEGVHRVSLIIETMGRRSNASLVDASGTILDVLKRVPPSRSPARPLLPHLPYVAPPPQSATLDPRDPRLAELLSERQTAATASNLAQFLGGNLAGFSPQACREAVFRGFGPRAIRVSEVTDWNPLAFAVRAMTSGLEDRAWSPSIALNDERVVAFAPYLITHLTGARVERVESIREAVERGMSADREIAPRAAANAAPLLKALAERRKSVDRRANALRHALSELPDPQAMLDRGNALLASLTAIRPDQASFRFNGVEYPLDASVKPLDQAKRVFRDYRKARDAHETLPRLLDTAERELEHLDDLSTLVELARTPEMMRTLRAELALAGLLGVQEQRKLTRRSAKYQAPTARPIRTQVEGFSLLIGTYSRANELITFRIARPDDIWLHARGIAGAHVVIQAEGRAIPPAVLTRAASLAAAYSASRAAARVEVDWTLRRHVRKIPGGPPGLVRYTDQESILTAPATDLPV